MKSFSVSSVMVSKSSFPSSLAPDALSVATIWGADSKEQQQRVTNLGISFIHSGQINKVKVDSKRIGRTNPPGSESSVPVAEAVRNPQIRMGLYLKRKEREKEGTVPFRSPEMTRMR